MARKIEDITITFLRECFLFDTEANALVWKTRPLCHFETERAWKQINTRFSGKIAGHRRKADGRRYIALSGGVYLAYRLIYALHHSISLIDVPGQVDHRDGDHTNDCPTNLRAATPAQNSANQPIARRNTCGFKGVTWNKARKKWQACIKVHGKSHYLGLFARPEDAHAAYMAAAKLHFGEFARAA
jgi:hypothetical protein